MGKRNWSLLLGCLLFGWGFGQSVDVWPGDANNNGIANHYDLLYIAANHGQTGPARNTVSSTWIAQPLQQLWGQGLPALPDPGYSDCDGDGLIGATDFAALQQNYALTWSGGPFAENSSLVTSGGAPLGLNFAFDSLFVSGSTTFTLQITLGDSVTQVDSILGLAFTIRYDTAVVDSMPGFAPGPLFASDTSFAYSFRDNRSLGELEISIARTTRNNIAGAGLVGTVVVALDDNIRVASNFDCPVGVQAAYAMTASGNPVELVAGVDTILILTQLDPQAEDGLILAYPNPSDDLLQVQLQGLGAAEMFIYDLRGTVVAMREIHAAHPVTLNTSAWPVGLYFLEVRTSGGVHRGKLLVSHGE